MREAWLFSQVRSSKALSARHMFTLDEDNRLMALVSELGDRDWNQITEKMPNRTTRQCRERYRNYLSPSLSTLPWSESEDELLMLKVRQFGQKWAQLTQFFVGRSDVSLKNRWAALSTRSRSRRRSKETPTREENPAIVPIRVPEPELKTEEMLWDEESPEFFMATLLWSNEKGEFDRDDQPLQSMWRNYGGDLW
jgi:hypothetical protein